MTEPGTSLAALNRTLVALAERMANVESTLAGDTNAVQETAPLEGRVRQIERVLTEIRKAVGDLAQKKATKDADAELRRPWHMLNSAQAEKRWLALRAWVEFLVNRNNIGAKEIPDCWYLHVGLVDELEALRWAWLDANRPDSKGSDRLWWREALARARTRWNAFNPNGCSRDHSKVTPRPVMDDAAWRNFLSEELADRPADRTARAS